MAATLVQPGLRHTRLVRSPLAIVIGQVRFSSVLRIAERGFIAPFQDAIRGSYPAVAEELEQGIIISDGAVQNLPGRRQWRFSSVDEQWAVLLSDNALTIETRSYVDADDFVGRFSACLGALSETIRPQLVERIGLRYVNECRHPQGSSAVGWRGLIAPAFLGVVDSEVTQRYQIQRSLQHLQIDQAGEETVVVRHGFFPAGSTVRALAESSESLGPFYLLDFDHFVVRRQEFDAPSITSTMARFHSVIWDLFRLAITDSLFEYFEPRRD